MYANFKFYEIFKCFCVCELLNDVQVLFSLDEFNEFGDVGMTKFS